MKYLLRIDLSSYIGNGAVPWEGHMIKLSDVKVRLQYRWRVRQRLIVLQFARLMGPRPRHAASAWVNLTSWLLFA